MLLLIMGHPRLSTASVRAASIPTAKLVFAKVAVVRKRHGVPHIIFRLGNARQACQRSLQPTPA